jgi:GNAT superfamily N-acetyltransferase
MDAGVVREIEEVSARAWPPLHVADLDGWVLRAAGGVTGRANSVWPRAHGGARTIDEKLAAADDFYAANGLPTVLQLSPAAAPADLAAELARRRYAITRAPRSVQIADLEEVLSVGDSLRAQISEVLTEDWYDTVAEVNTSFAAQREAARAMLRGVGQSSAYAVVTIDGVAAAVGRGVWDGEWLGIFNMATRPAYRRQGGAAAVLAALAEWALARRASRAYLQMDADNNAAPLLYAKAGFAPAYEYAFWAKVASP